MEQKKSIVRSAIFQKAHSGANGLFYIHEITFDNNDKGKYFSKTETQDVFKEGQEVEYTIEKKENGQYTNFNIKPFKAATNGFTPNKGNPAIEHKRVALRCAVDLCAAGKYDITKISEYAKSFMKFLNE